VFDECRWVKLLVECNNGSSILKELSKIRYSLTSCLEAKFTDLSCILFEVIESRTQISKNSSKPSTFFKPRSDFTNIGVTILPFKLTAVVKVIQPQFLSFLRNIIANLIISGSADIEFEPFSLKSPIMRFAYLVL